MERQDSRIKRQSQKLSWLLRHGAREAGLETMDEAGWVDVQEVLRHARMSPEALRRVVEENNKSRLQWEGERIRACQGHSLEGTPVTREALEASWVCHEGTGLVWHGTSVEALASIAREGIEARARSHVHLADGLSSRTGKRAGVAVMLGVSPALMRERGHGLWQSPNGVVLARFVPPECITGAVLMTRRAHEQRGAVAARFPVLDERQMGHTNPTH